MAGRGHSCHWLCYFHPLDLRMYLSAPLFPHLYIDDHLDTHLPVVGEIRKEKKIIRNFALCPAHPKCPVKIMREKSNGSRYP